MILWWAFIHNPRVIKEKEAEIAQLHTQVESAQAAVNLLTQIQKDRYETEQNSNRNIDKIRNGRKPGRSGSFIASGVLPKVYQDYSSVGGAPFDALSELQSLR